MRKKNTNEPLREPYGNEQFGIPSDCTKPQKFNGLKLCIYIFIVCALCVGVYFAYQTAADYFLPEMHFDRSAEPYVYIKNNDLMLRQPLEKKGEKFAGSENFYVHPQNEDSALCAFSSDMKYLFFVGDNVNGGDGFSLFYRMVKNDRDGETEIYTVAENITDYKLRSDGKGVLFRRGGLLYRSDLKQTAVIADHVAEYFFSYNNQNILYYKEDGSMYVCGVGETDKPRAIAYGITKLISDKDNPSEVYYLKGNELYAVSENGEAELITPYAEDAMLLEKRLYFTVRETKTFDPFTAVFTDDCLRYDETLSDSSATEVQLAGKQNRNAIRAYYRENPPAYETVSLYQTSRGKIRKIDDDLLQTSFSAVSCKSIAVYKKANHDVDKVKLSTISDLSHAEDILMRLIQAEPQAQLCVLRNGKPPFSALEQAPEGNMEITPDGKFFYCLTDIVDGRGTLVRYNINTKSFDGAQTIAEGVTDFTVDGADAKAVFCFDGARFSAFVDNRLSLLSETSSRDLFYVDGSLYYYDEYNAQTQSGTLMLYRNGKSKVIDRNVHEFSARNYRTVLYLKNYDTELGVGDLFYKEGNKKRKKMDLCVRTILFR